MRTSIATVCLAGSLVEKLHACAAAGFDGVEIMDSDLISAEESPEEIRELCRRLGLRIDLFQPFRDFEGVDEATFESNMRRAEAKFAVMNRLGAKMMLLCSNVATATNPDPARAAEQLGALADAASRHGIRIAYEALAWGKYVSDYRDAWSIVERADRANLGLCLDSFHILSRGHDLRGIEEIDPYKLFFLQLADAPRKDMDLLSWSRHHRLFPGEGDFELTELLSRVLIAGYRGPLSLEVFNDVFRQTDPQRTASHAWRSLRWLYDRTASVNDWDSLRLEPAQPPQGVDFAEIRGSGLHAVERLLDQLGFQFVGTHRTEPARLWCAGEARVILNEADPAPEAHLAGLGLTVADADAAARRGHAITSSPALRRTEADDHALPVVVAPDGMQIVWGSSSAKSSWIGDFVGGPRAEGHSPSGLDGVIDHVNVSYSWQEFDEAVLFHTSVLALEAASSEDIASQQGLVRSKVMRTDDGAVRIAMNLAPATAPLPPRHIAIRVDDAVDAARRAKERGLKTLHIPVNYYEDLVARFDLEPALVAQLREFDLLYDRDGEGDYIHFYTERVGAVFFEIVERRNRYDGYGAESAPIRLAAQRSLAE